MCSVNVVETNVIFVWCIFVLQVFTALILILSIHWLKRLIRSHNMSKLVMNERLMHIHTGLYLMFISCFMMQTVAHHLRHKEFYNSDPVDYKSFCRACKAETMSYALMTITNIGILCLQTFMSAKFSAPVCNSRKKFLLVYQAKPR